jgi:competence protein ComEC
LAVVHCFCPEAIFSISKSGWEFPGRRILSALRQKLNRITWMHVGTPQAAFASAIMLGNREQLGRERNDLFLVTGTIHILSISGLHVGILAGVFLMLYRLGLISRTKALWGTMAFVIFYAWLVEFSPPVLRAAILIILYCLGRLLGRSRYDFNFLAIAGLIVLLFNPCDLFNAGAQLSFLAIATMIFCQPWIFWPPSQDPLHHLIANTRSWQVRTMHWIGRRCREAFVLSSLIWLVSLPLIAERFHLVAPIALIVNPLLLIPIAWALYAGLAVLAFGWLFPPLADWCGELCNWNLSLIEWMVSTAAQVPLGYWWTSGPSVWAVTMFYFGLLVLAVYPVTRMQPKYIFAAGAVWLVFCWLVPHQLTGHFERRAAGELICTFVDVGHGTSVLIEMPCGKTMLYDAGSFGSAVYGTRNVASVLWSKGIEHLDAVVVSHADVDHFNVLPKLCQQFSIGVVYLSPAMQSSDSAAVMGLLRELRRMNIRTETICAGDRLIVGHGDDVTIKALGPPESGMNDSDNSDSVVLLVEYCGKRMLLPGDLEASGMLQLLSQPPIDCDVVMAPHHGSPNSLPVQFLQWATPEYVVISGSGQRVDDDIAKLFESATRTVARTDVDGAIQFRLKSMDAHHWQNSQWQKLR